jgi:hypothetical protein
VAVVTGDEKTGGTADGKSDEKNGEMTDVTAAIVGETSEDPGEKIVGGRRLSRVRSRSVEACVI